MKKSLSPFNPSLTLAMLDSVNRVDVITDSGIHEFQKMFVGTWNNPVKQDFVKPKTMLQILKGYDRAGCIVMPISETDEARAFINLPENCIRVRVSDVNDDTKFRIDKVIGMQDVWVDYYTDRKMDENAVMQKYMKYAEIGDGATYKLKFYDGELQLITQYTLKSNRRDTDVV